MVKQFFQGYTAEVDLLATKEWYANSMGWDCDCEHCRNFLKVAARREFPGQVLEMLKEFDISPEKATYVCALNPEEDKCLYLFSYRIAGQMLSPEPECAELYEWGNGWLCHESYPFGAPDFPTPNFDLEFWVTLPWISDAE